MNSKIIRQPRTMNAMQQGLMPGRYSVAIQIFSMLAFTLAFVGWLNGTWLFWFDNPVWLNRYTEYLVILGFGVWRIIAEENYYTRKRLIILVFMITVFWWMIPWLYRIYEPYIGFPWAQPIFPALHIPGTLTFFLVLGLVFLFGRRIICGFNCPCVAIRETVGFSFRNKTPRSDLAWNLRHFKWLFFSYYLGIMIVTQFPPTPWTISFVTGFYALVAVTYFGTFFLAPIIGNRSYCRYLCPYGATFGVLNHIGYYGIEMDRDKCNDCQRCEQVCDMGIPVWRQGKKAGRVTGLADCMGCARCVLSCPTDALEIKDIRNWLQKSLVQNGSYLLKRKPIIIPIRSEPVNRPATMRKSDWSEIAITPELTKIQQQASRCIDCGLPGCINACPLHNRIPEWLEQVALGDFKQAAIIAHSTSNFPEICGSLCPQHRLCEGSCTKARESGGAVTIGTIERFLANMALENGWMPELQPNQHKNIAIIGAGPAGLACADELNKAGYNVTVIEQNPMIGGLLATGVPTFKLDRNILERRHQLLEQQGIVFQLNTKVDKYLLNKLITNNDAIFLGTGSQHSRKLEITGEYISAIEYLAKTNEFSTEITGKQVLVLGGGDTAMDCARSAIRQQAKQVTVIYRGKKPELRASPKEIQAAIDEGVQFLFEHNPVQSDQPITRMIFNTPTTPQTIPCNTIIYAIGQVNKPVDWLTDFGITTAENGSIQIDRNGKTTNPKIYAGGDNTNSPDLIVTAIVAGRKAAHGIIADFTNKGMNSK